MKHYYLKALTLLSCLLIGITTHAHDFEVQNGNGVTIYYNITSSTDLTCEVTYQGSTSNFYTNEYTGTVIIPESVAYAGTVYSVTSIGRYAFSNCNGVTSVIIPNTVSYIGDMAFYNCSGLTNITITNSVTNIGSGAFFGCIGLTSVEFNAENCVTQGSSGALIFTGCTNLSSITIGEDVKTIPNSVFSNCTGLRSVKIGNNVTTIDNRAFSGCTGLTSIEIPNSVLNIGDNAFQGCSSLTSVIIPNSVTNIGKMAFYACSRLTGITIPNSVTCIGRSAFCYCYGLISIKVEKGNSVYDSRDNCNAIIETKTNTLIRGCNNTTIPNTITNINEMAFVSCLGLNNIIIPNSITCIGDNAFSRCTGLKSITIPNSITEIGLGVFSNCTGLTNIFIPNSVTSIGPGTFSGCTGLTDIMIPNSVKNIGNGAFYGCDGLTRINSIKSNPTKLMYEISNNTDYQSYVEINDKYYNINNKTIEVSGLKPDSPYYYEFGLIINNIYCDITQSNSTTSQFNVEIEGESGVCSIYTKGSYNDENIEIIGLKLSLNNDDIEYDNLNEKTFTNLDPNTNYTVYYSVNTKEGGVYSASKTFTTGALTWSNAEYQATSTTSARLMTETNCDATEGTGFEWRRYGAPENLKPNAVACPVVDGMLVGSLRNLNSEAYYEFRPYYTSSSGKTYCGEWAALFTGDANVYFEPEVRTYGDVVVATNNATLKGYALAGTDEITSQGFEYWKSSNQPSAEAQLNVVLDSKTVTADGISMSALIENLDYGTTYCYRAFATTDKGTVYGDTMEFTTDNEPSGIEETIVDGCEDAPVEYYNLQGVRVVNPERGLYIKRQGGKTSKVIL